MSTKYKRMSIGQDLQERLEALKLEFNTLVGKISSRRSKEEKKKLKAERDRLKMEMDLLRAQLTNIFH